MKNSIEFWSDICLEVVRRDYSKKPDGSPVAPEKAGPTTTSRALAIVHLAMHDAWFGTTQPAICYLPKKGVALPAVLVPLSQDSCMGTAAALTLLAMYPGQRPFIEKMSTVFIDPSTDAAARDNGHRYGEKIAQAMLALRKTDKADRPMAYRPSAAYGRHRADPYDPLQGYTSPQWGQVALFCTAALHPLDPPPGYGLPDYLSDMDYRQDLKEVKADGALHSTTRKADEAAYGVYWGYDGANEIGVPPRLYNQVARAWLDQHFPGNVGKAVRLLAKVNAGMADAGINAWHHKYEYNLWRPVVGIREASMSVGPGAVGGGNAAATPGANLGDPAWAPLGLPRTNEPEKRAFSRTPGFPAYPSGHATFGAVLFQIMQIESGAAPMTLQDVLDASGNVPAVPAQEFEFVSDELNGQSVDADGSVRPRHLRSFGTFARATYENSVSRVYIGVHWRFDGLPRAVVPGKNYGGVPLGLAIGVEAAAFF